MPLLIYNTRTKTKEALQALDGRTVRMYVCGITAYDFCHIGHARSVLVFDMIYRYLRASGFAVFYVRNFTDIDDKIIKRAAELATDPKLLAERFIDEFKTDMAALGVESPDVEPRATEHLPEIIKMVERLVEAGLAYAAGGDVFYAVDRFPGYGSLSGRSFDEMQAGARVEVNALKKNPMDFVLWKASKPGEPFWESPWGPGRPGWHIECSAMSRKYLGDSFDIHGGGKDLVFPHHENEIAQSSGATGEEFARIWIHHGFVTIREEKMSKSLGNFLTIREVLERFSPEALRLFVLSSHYRNPLDYSEEALADAEAGLERLYACLADCALAQSRSAGDAGAHAVSTPEERDRIATLARRFTEAMDNDFNSAAALGLVFDAVKTLNRVCHAVAARPHPEDAGLIGRGAADIRRLASLLGLLTRNENDFLREREDAHLRRRGMGRGEIDALVAERAAARAAKDWKRGDLIRDRLLEMGIALRDGATGTIWRLARQERPGGGS